MRNMLCFSVLTLSGCANIAQMDMTAQEIQKLSDLELCRKHISIFDTKAITHEVNRRSLTADKCKGMVRAADAKLAQASANQGAGSSDPKIVNSNSPNCKGLSIESAGSGLFRGVAQGMQVVVKNTTGQKKWIQADIKYTTDIRSIFQNAEQSWWETTKPLVTYESGTSQFWVRQGGTAHEKNLRMLEVKVTGCGS